MKRLRLPNLRPWIPVLFLPLSLLLLMFSRAVPSFAEWYATGPYRWLSHWGNLLSFCIPYSSIGEMLVLAAIPVCLGYLIYFFIQWRKHRESRRETLCRFFRNALCAISLLAFLFTICCGINYSRYTFAQTSGLRIQPSSKEELQELCQSLAGDVTALRQQVQTDANGITTLDASVNGTAKQARSAMRAASADYPLLDGTYLGPKPVLFSRALSACQITGIFFPFTFEANVNIDIPDYSIPSTMCHELAHLSGFMREDEANFIAYLACIHSESAEFQYSGKMLAYIHVFNALFAEDPQAAQEISASLGEGVRMDLNANNAYWDQFESPVAEVANQVNNAYLKANRQQDGVRSYGRVVDLLLAEHRAKQEATSLQTS